MGAIDITLHVNRKMSAVQAKQHGQSLIDDARISNGTGGYTGTIAECTGIQIRGDCFDTFAEAERFLVGYSAEDQDPDIRDGVCQKWGPMIGVPLRDGTWAFGACCSS